MASDWLATGKVRVLLQHGSKPHRLFPDVQLFRSFARNEAERQILDIINVRQEIAKPYFAPPGVPAERLEILRRAFDAALADPDFQHEAERQKMEIDDPLKGEQLAEVVNRVASTPPEVVRQLVDLFRKYNDKK